MELKDLKEIEKELVDLHTKGILLFDLESVAMVESALEDIKEYDIQYFYNLTDEKKLAMVNKLRDMRLSVQLDEQDSANLICLLDYHNIDFTSIDKWTLGNYVTRGYTTAIDEYTTTKEFADGLKEVLNRGY